MSQTQSLQKQLFGLTALIFTVMLLLAACQPNTVTPRLATATAMAQQQPTETPTRLVITAPTPTTTSANQPNPQPITEQANPSISLLVNESDLAHKAALQAMMDDFTAQYQIDVALQFVSPDVLPQIVETAVMSDAIPLPDLILHPIEYTHGWAQRGLFNTQLTADLITQLGPDTFDPAALELVTVNNGFAALPVHGAYQLIIYRQDWFSERDLAIPDNFDALFAAAETLTDRENLVAGFVIPTASYLPTTQQAFEHLARANGCQLIDTAGEVHILEQPCQEALDFYFSIVNQFSPIGVQTDISTRNAYLSGRTGLVMAPPSLLVQIAGLDPEDPPTCPQCTSTPNDFLAQNSRILTTVRGNGDNATTATFANLTNLGITRVADAETAEIFATYWLNEGYPQWLAIHTERKVPLRWGTTTQPRQFIDSWGTIPIANSSQSLQDIYGNDVVMQLKEGIAQPNRWALNQQQGALLTELYLANTFPTVLQEMLSGYFGSQQTRIEAYLRITELIPNYPFTPDEELLLLEEDAS